jgi:long-chain acyl-CoA synthetase
MTHPRSYVDTQPDHPAIIFADSGKTLTYRELVDRADRVAALFAAQGLVEGDTVAFLLENQITYPELLWGAKNSGIRYVCVSTHLNPADTAYLISDCGAKLLVVSQDQYKLACDAIDQLSVVPILLIIGEALSPFQSYDDLLATMEPVHLLGRRRGPSMLYSSGTTGRPKGVKTAIPDSSPETPPARFGMLVKQYGFSKATVFVNSGPFYHSAPNRFMMSVLRAGGTVIGFSKFDSAEVLAAIERYRVTHGFFVPTMFKRMLDYRERELPAVDLQTMQCAIHAAAPCPVEIKKRMIEWWGPVIEELYAGTEAFGHTFISSKEWLMRPGSVGKPAPGCEIKIVDTSGQRLPPGQPGRIMMANGLRISYHGDIDKSAALYDSEGFASLGDIGFLDQEGYLFLTDRESHMIIAGGVNIYPQEAESVIGLHPYVSDVAVIGIPDDDMGEAVHGIVELMPNLKAGDDIADQIISFCCENLSLHKCPRTITFIDVLPRSPAGKLLKQELRRPYWGDTDRIV